jgi:hypothetical protein
MGNRGVDLLILEAMCPDIKSVADLKERYAPRVADLLWDHWLGEPKEPSLVDINDICRLMCDALYTMSEEVRNSLG